MKQYHITSDNLNQDSSEDCILDPTDPIHEIKSLQYLAGLGHSQRMNTANSQVGNISITGYEKQQLEKKHNIKPGTDEWFRLWFSLPYLTGEKPVRD